MVVPSGTVIASSFIATIVSWFSKSVESSSSSFSRILSPVVITCSSGSLSSPFSTLSLLVSSISDGSSCSCTSRTIAGSISVVLIISSGAMRSSTSTLFMWIVSVSSLSVLSFSSGAKTIPPIDNNKVRLPSSETSFSLSGAVSLEISLSSCISATSGTGSALSPSSSSTLVLLATELLLDVAISCAGLFSTKRGVSSRRDTLSSLSALSSLSVISAVVFNESSCGLCGSSAPPRSDATGFSVVSSAASLSWVSLTLLLK
mmetsp:Transcript_10635/g.19383  ORF Transcript_10635/g.19383 Transcript_10635/m.19383 type:complete len:260 (+) Transcript_10635:1290-2069(+)